MSTDNSSFITGIPVPKLVWRRVTWPWQKCVPSAVWNVSMNWGALGYIKGTRFIRNFSPRYKRSGNGNNTFNSWSCSFWHIFSLTFASAGGPLGTVYLWFCCSKEQQDLGESYSSPTHLLGMCHLPYKIMQGVFLCLGNYKARRQDWGIHCYADWLGLIH